MAKKERSVSASLENTLPHPFWPNWKGSFLLQCLADIFRKQEIMSDMQTKEALLLLHGALGTADSMKAVAERLKKDYEVHTLHFYGHGGRPVEEPMSVALFAQDVLKYLEEQELDRVALFGFSMGGYVGLYLAATFPERVSKIATLGTKFSWSPEIAAREVRMLDTDKIAEKVPAFADALAKRHHPQDWKEVVRQTRQFLLGLGEDPALKKETLCQLVQPVVVGYGELDNMVSLEESREAAECIPNGHFRLLPATPHPIEKADPELLATFLREALG